MPTLQEFNDRVVACVREKDGYGLVELLGMRATVTAEPAEEYISSGGSLPPALDEPWDSLPALVEKRFAATGALSSKNWVDASAHLSDGLQIFLQILTAESAWCMPLLHSLCADVRLLSEVADQQLQAEGQKPCQLEDAERVLKRAFAVTNQDRRPLNEGSRKIGALGVSNQLLKVYFKLNNLRLCSNITRTVEAPNFPKFDVFPGPHRVIYKYFTGRLHLYDNRCSEAVQALTYAFENIQTTDGRSAKKHKKQILLFLVPAKILKGSLPSAAMLDEYDLKCYVDIRAAIRTGNMRLFDDAVVKYEEFFIRKALLLVIEKMRPMVYRSLCRKIFTVSNKVNKISFENLKVCLNVCNVEMDNDEIECILANLIFNNYIRGYISHKVKFLVLSKKNPFPRLVDVLKDHEG